MRASPRCPSADRHRPGCRHRPRCRHPTNSRHPTKFRHPCESRDPFRLGPPWVKEFQNLRPSHPAPTAWVPASAGMTAWRAPARFAIRGRIGALRLSNHRRHHGDCRHPAKSRHPCASRDPFRLGPPWVTEFQNLRLSHPAPTAWVPAFAGMTAWGAPARSAIRGKIGTLRPSNHLRHHGDCRHPTKSRHPCASRDPFRLGPPWVKEFQNLRPSHPAPTAWVPASAGMTAWRAPARFAIRGRIGALRLSNHRRHHGDCRHPAKSRHPCASRDPFRLGPPWVTEFQNLRLSHPAPTAWVPAFAGMTAVGSQ